MSVFVLLLLFIYAAPFQLDSTQQKLLLSEIYWGVSDFAVYSFRLTLSLWFHSLLSPLHSGEASVQSERPSTPLQTKHVGEPLWTCRGPHIIPHPPCPFTWPLGLTSDPCMAPMSMWTFFCLCASGYSSVCRSHRSHSARWRRPTRPRSTGGRTYTWPTSTACPGWVHTQVTWHLQGRSRCSVSDRTQSELTLRQTERSVMFQSNVGGEADLHHLWATDGKISCSATAASSCVSVKKILNVSLKLVVETAPLG